MSEREIYIHITTTPNDSNIRCSIQGSAYELADCLAMAMVNMMNDMNKKDRMVFKALIDSSVQNGLAALEDKEINDEID